MSVVNPTKEIMTTVEMLKITDITPTIAIFWSKLIFFFNANMSPNPKHTRLAAILTQVPVVL